MSVEFVYMHVHVHICIHVVVAVHSQDSMRLVCANAVLATISLEVPKQKRHV